MRTLLRRHQQKRPILHLHVLGPGPVSKHGIQNLVHIIAIHHVTLQNIDGLALIFDKNPNDHASHPTAEARPVRILRDDAATVFPCRIEDFFPNLRTETRNVEQVVVKILVEQPRVVVLVVVVVVVVVVRLGVGEEVGQGLNAGGETVGSHGNKYPDSDRYSK